jgi:hypothetical protein
MGVCAKPESVISHILSHTMQGREEVWTLETSIAIDVWGIVSSVRRPGERKLTIAKMINSDDVSME